MNKLEGFSWDDEESRVGYLPYDDEGDPTLKGWYRVERDYTIFLTTDGNLFLSSEHNPNVWMEIPRDELIKIVDFIKNNMRK